MKTLKQFIDEGKKREERVEKAMKKVFSGEDVPTKEQERQSKGNDAKRYRRMFKKSEREKAEDEEIIRTGKDLDAYHGRYSWSH